MPYFGGVESFFYQEVILKFNCPKVDLLVGGGGDMMMLNDE